MKIYICIKMAVDISSSKGRIKLFEGAILIRYRTEHNAIKLRRVDE
jgi:hypothetical protein